MEERNATKTKNKNKRDLGKIAITLDRVLLALLMILAVSATLIYYL